MQADAAYLGVKLTGGTSGRGSGNKRPFLIAAAISTQGDPGLAVITPVPVFSKKAFEDWGTIHLKPGAEEYSDGLGAFR